MAAEVWVEPQAERDGAEISHKNKEELAMKRHKKHKMNKGRIRC